MTAQISKVVERLIKGMIEPHLEAVNAYGENQFAYRKGRGSRDLVLLVMLEWLTALNNRQKIAVFSSDVSGAFDKVETGRLMEKLKYHGLHQRIIDLIFSWLQARNAKVLVGGPKSDLMILINQVFQGTVLGPMLWDLFFEDIKSPIRNAKFREVTFADDLNSYRVYKANATNETIGRHGKKFQDGFCGHMCMNSS